MTFLSDDEALAIVQSYNDEIISISEIEWEWQEAYYMVRLDLKLGGCSDVSESDDEELEMLKHAEACLMLEFLARKKLINVTHGDIRKQTQGRVSVEMQQSYPLFFFGGSDSSVRGENVTSMLSHATLWQLGHMFAYMFCDAQATWDDIILLSTDRTTRGRGWDADFTTT